MKSSFESTLEAAVAALREALGENLFSCCVYGSVVRGNAIAGVSDINLLIVLGEATPAADEAIARALGAHRQIDPFVLPQRGFERSVRAFASKFASIRRNYRVLHGADVLAGVKIDATLERFLCEQAIRNVRLRLTYAFVVRAQQKAYDKFVVRQVSAFFIQFSEVLRLEGHPVPPDFSARIPLLERELGLDATILRDLIALKAKPRRWSDAEAIAWHARLVPMIDTVLRFIETRWSA